MTEKYEPFRNAKVGDKVKAPQFFGDKICQIANVRPTGAVDTTNPDNMNEDTRTFLADGSWSGATGTNVERALWYVNDKGGMVGERPKKMVEKVIAEGETKESMYTFNPLAVSLMPSAYINIPVGTPYKIIVEVEE